MPPACDDGDVEELMLACALRDAHSAFFDCFEDYEKCIKGAKDEQGNSIYNCPNLKGKLLTYISAQRLNRDARNRLGSGDWLLDRPEYWDLDIAGLGALKGFLSANLK